MQTLLLFASNTAPALTPALLAALSEAGYECVRASLDGGDKAAQDALRHAFGGRPPDLVLADLSQSSAAPAEHHLRRMLAETWPDSPIPPFLALLSPACLPRSDWMAAVDDFILVPCQADEMTARLKLLAFRLLQTRPDSTLAYEGVCLDLNQQVASVVPNGSVLPLTPREWHLLRFLITHRGKFWTRGHLLDLVWGVCYEGGERTVDIHIRRLRAKLPPSAAARLQTRHGLGYGFAADE